jgi:putative phage-type endonuclease
VPVEKLIFESKAGWLERRHRNINSTEVSCLFNVNPYQSQYELWQTKKSGFDIDFKESEAMAWGKRLEPVIAHEIAEANQWDIVPKKEYFEDTDLRMGSSFDFEVISPFSSLLEIKNVGQHAARNWIFEEEAAEAPAHIELQLQHQMLLSGIETGYIGALIGGNRRVLFQRVLDSTFAAAIKEKIEAFWESIEANNPPKPTTDNDFVMVRAQLGTQVSKGRVIDVSNMGNFKKKALELFSVKTEITRLEKRADRLKTELMLAMGDAERAVGDGFHVVATEVPESVIPPKLEPTVRKAHKRLQVRVMGS